MTEASSSTAQILEAARMRWSTEASAINRQPRWSSDGTRRIAAQKAKEAFEKAEETLSVVDGLAAPAPELQEAVDAYQDAWRSMIRLYVARSNSPDARIAAFRHVQEHAVKRHADIQAVDLSHERASKKIEELIERANKAKENADKIREIPLVDTRVVEPVMKAFKRLRAVEDSPEVIEMKNLGEGAVEEVSEVEKTAVNQTESVLGRLGLSFTDLSEFFGRSLTAVSSVVGLWAALDDSHRQTYAISLNLLKAEGGVVGGKIGSSVRSSLNDAISAASETGEEAGGEALLEEAAIDATMALVDVEAEEASAALGSVTYGIGFVVGTLATAAIDFTIEAVWSGLFGGRSIPASLRIGIQAPLSAEMSTALAAEISTSLTTSITADIGKSA